MYDRLYYKSLTLPIVYLSSFLINFRICFVLFSRCFKIRCNLIYEMPSVIEFRIWMSFSQRYSEYIDCLWYCFVDYFNVYGKNGESNVGQRHKITA